MNNKFFSSKPVMPDTGLLLVRVITGGFLVYHGWEIFSPAKMNEYLQWDMFKNNSAGKLLVYMGKGAELLGGGLLAIGLFTRVAASMIIATMCYISFFVGHGKVWYDDQHPFLFVLLGIVFLFAGGGNCSADHLIFNKRQTNDHHA